MALAALALLAAGLTAAGASPCLPLQPGDADGNHIVPGVRGGIVYRRAGGRDLLLDAYVHGSGEPRPAVLVVHGGGWTAGSRVAFVGQLLETLTRAGYDWFSLGYRLGGLAAYEEALDDLRAALAFVRCHAGELRIDPERIAVLGEDSGAHLAALLATEKPAGLAAAVLIGGFYDLRRIPALEAAAPPDVRARASPMTQTRAGMPDVLVLHGGADQDAPPEQARAFCAAVKAVGSSCEDVVVEKAIHRVENWLPSQWGYKATLVEWLRRSIGPGTPAPPPASARLQKDITYDVRHGLRLDARIPDGAGPFPAVIVVHGGGWEAGDKVTYITPVLGPLARAGLAWFSIDYRLTPAVRHPEQMDDLRRAVAFVRENAARFRVDPDRLVVLGESASGQMAALLATEDRRLAGAISFYGVYDFTTFLTDASAGSRLERLFGFRSLDDESREVLRRHSPLFRATRDMPSVLLIHGTAERLWAQGVAFRDRLRELGARHELIALEGAPHGMENWEGRPEWEGYKARMVEWLTGVLRPAN